MIEGPLGAGGRRLLLWENPATNLWLFSQSKGQRLSSKPQNLQFMAVQIDHNIMTESKSACFRFKAIWRSLSLIWQLCKEPGWRPKWEAMQTHRAKWQSSIIWWVDYGPAPHMMHDGSIWIRFWMRFKPVGIILEKILQAIIFAFGGIKVHLSFSHKT